MEDSDKGDLYMDFIISSAKIRNKDIEIVCGKDTPSGVRKIASKVAGDIKAVFGYEPAVVDSSKCKSPVYVGLAGDEIIDELGVDTADIKEKREVYKIEVSDSALVITGSDKRGAIYGLFKLSEMLGVSPFIDWLDVKPPKMKEFINYLIACKTPVCGATARPTGHGSDCIFSRSVISTATSISRTGTGW